MTVHIRFPPHPVTNDTLKLYNIHLRPSSVADPGEGPRGSDPPLLSDETGAKLFFGDRPTLPPPPILGSEWSTSALISRSASVTALRVTYYILHVQGVLKVRSDFFFAQISLIIENTFVKFSMLFIIHLTLNNRNIANQNVFLYVFWHFLSGEVKNVRAPKVCLKTHFFRRSVVTALLRPVIWGLVLCMFSGQR